MSKGALNHPQAYLLTPEEAEEHLCAVEGRRIPPAVELMSLLNERLALDAGDLIDQRQAHRLASVECAELRQRRDELANACTQIRRYLRSLVALKAVEGPNVQWHINLVEEALRKAGKL